MRPAERLWRVRKDSRTLDAILRTDPDTDDVELQFFYNRELLLGQRFRGRGFAEQSAAGRLNELQICGWATHW